MTAQAKTSSRRDVRKNAAKDLWTRPAQPVTYGREQFRFRLDRTARRLETVDLDPYTENAQWQRAGANRTGSLEFRRPLGSHPASLIAYGDYVICEWDELGAGQFNRLWRMKVINPQDQVIEGMLTAQLSSVLSVMTASKVAWRFRDGKAHPHGWDARQITLNVTSRFNVPVGHLPEATWKIRRHFPKHASPEDVITWAWGQERKYSGRRFDIDSSTGVLNITELAEPQYMLVFGASMLDATVTQTMGGLASAVTAVSTHKVKGHKKDTKLRVRVVDQSRLSRYGYIVKSLHAPSSVQSPADLRDWAKRRLATMFGQKKHLTFTHPGVPLMDRGSACRIYLPEADVDQVVYATDVQHTLSAGDYEIDVTVGFDDPFTVDERKARVNQKKAAAAARRRRQAQKKKKQDDKSPKPAKAKVRSNS